MIDHNGIFGQFYSAANVMLYFDEKAEDLMVTVKFFAGAREAAGTSSMEVEADSVQAALDAAVAASGDALARMISISKIWLNGEPAEPEAAVSSSDELAVLPPVSGGI